MAKTRKPKTIAINMTTEVVSAEDAALSSLLAALTAPGEGAADEVVEPAIDSSASGLVDETAIEPAGPTSFAEAVGATDEPAAVISDEEIAAAVSGAEAVETMIAAATTHVADGSVTGETSDAPAPETAAAETEAKPKKVPVPRKHYTNKAERIKDRLGDDLPEFTILTLDDAAGALDEDSVRAKMDETMTLIAGFSKKKQNRAGFLLEFVSGKKATLNNVMSIALRTLHDKGAITTGKEGNYLTALLAVPYSPAAARAMGGNTVSVLEDLKLIIPDGKGKFVANPESLLLAKVNSMLGLGTEAAPSA